MCLASETLGNHSLLFQRRGHSWHGVREIRCPQVRYRKIFIVVLNRPPADPTGTIWVFRQAEKGIDLSRGPAI